jgi:hypothetical protein
LDQQRRSCGSALSADPAIHAGDKAATLQRLYDELLERRNISRNNVQAAFE